MEPINTDKAAAMIAKGKWNFVIKFGVLLWGVVTAVLMTLLQWLFFEHEKPLQLLMVSLVVFSVIGMFCGLYMWKKINREYDEADRTR